MPTPTCPSGPTFSKLLQSLIFLELKDYFFFNSSWQTLKPQALWWFILSFIWSYPSASSSLLKCCFQNSLQAASYSLSSKKYWYEHKVQSWELKYLKSNPKIHPASFGLVSPPTFRLSRANFPSFPPGLGEVLSKTHFVHTILVTISLSPPAWEFLDSESTFTVWICSNMQSQSCLYL